MESCVEVKDKCAKMVIISPKITIFMHKDKVHKKNARINY